MWNFSFFITVRLFLPPLIHTRCSSRQSVQRPSSQVLESEPWGKPVMPGMSAHLNESQIHTREYTHLKGHAYTAMHCCTTRLLHSLSIVCVCVCSRIALHMRHSCTVVLFSWGSNRISSPSVLSCLLDTHSHTFLNANAHTVHKQWVQRTKTDTLVCLIK